MAALKVNLRYRTTVVVYPMFAFLEDFHIMFKQDAIDNGSFAVMLWFCQSIEVGDQWFGKQMAHFIDCCRTGQQPVTGAKEGIEVTRIAEAALSVGDRPAIIEL